MGQPSVVALIPARAGSKRVVGKNMRELEGKPLLYWAIKSALESGIFQEVYVSTDSEEYADCAKSFGASVILCQIPTAHTDTSPDVEWIRHALENIASSDTFAILRVTSPFRTAETIQRAWAEFRSGNCDSIRAVEKVSQHPGKMWMCRGPYMYPLLLQPPHPWHSSQMAAMPTVHVQNASLEICKTSNVKIFGHQAGGIVKPFFTEGYEGFDINTELDFKMAELLLAEGVVSLGA